jgi:hypothetical protein
VWRGMDRHEELRAIEALGERLRALAAHLAAAEYRTDGGVAGGRYSVFWQNAQDHCQSH